MDDRLESSYEDLERYLELHEELEDRVDPEDEVTWGVWESITRRLERLSRRFDRLSNGRDASQAEIEEVMITMVAYGGFPRAIDGMRLARKVFTARGLLDQA